MAPSDRDPAPTPPPPLPASKANGRSLPSLPPPAFSFKDATMDLILEDLSSRFILNLPDNELSSVERVCFQVEQAHWYYEDFIRQENPSLPSMPLRHFSAKLFAACPLLQGWSHRHEEAFADFVKYKTSVPVCGAILLNSTWDKCVLVKGWKSSAPWGFPRGKINENEPLHNCAIREVLEETGYDCESRLLEDAYITLYGKDQQLVTLFVVPNVPEDYQFLTRTRKEISKIDWFELSTLPGWADDDHSHRGITNNSKAGVKTWNVSAFLAQLRARLPEFQQLFGYVPKAHGRRSQPVSGQRTPAKPRNGSSESEDFSDPYNPGATASYNESSSQSSADPITPSSANAMFVRSAGSEEYHTPQLQAISTTSTPEKATRRGKGKAKNKNQSPQVFNSTTAAVSASTVTTASTGRGVMNEQDAASVHLNNLMQGLFKSSAKLGLSSSNGHGEAEVSSSGLPTPAESPQNATIPAAPHQSKDANRTPKALTRLEPEPPKPEPATHRSMFDFVSPFDALSISPTLTPTEISQTETSQSLSPPPSATSAKAKAYEATAPGAAPTTSKIDNLAFSPPPVAGADRSMSMLIPQQPPSRPVLPSRSASDTTRLGKERLPAPAANAVSSPLPHFGLGNIASERDLSPLSAKVPTPAERKPSTPAERPDRTVAHLALLNMVASEASAVAQLPTPTDPITPPVSLPPVSNILYSSYPPVQPTIQPAPGHSYNPPTSHHGLSPAPSIIHPASQPPNLVHQNSPIPPPQPHYAPNGLMHHAAPYYTPVQVPGRVPNGNTQFRPAFNHATSPLTPAALKPSQGVHPIAYNPMQSSPALTAPLASNRPPHHVAQPPLGNAYPSPVVDRRASTTNFGSSPSPAFTQHIHGNGFQNGPVTPGAPNPNSFNVQRPPTNRNQLLDMLRAKSPSKLPNSPSLGSVRPNGSPLPYQQQMAGKMNYRVQTPLNGHPLSNNPGMTPSPALSAGLIPSTVQYRALAGTPLSAIHPGFSGERRSTLPP